MDKNFIIFLGGQQGSGKSSAAQYIDERAFNQGFSSSILKFADPVYKIAEVVEEKMCQILGQEPSKKNGSLLQKIGTDIGREIFDKNIWVKDLHRRINRYVMSAQSTGSSICLVVEDVRMINEFELMDTLKKQYENFTIFSVYFNAPEEVRKTRTNSWRENTSHESEQCYTFQNLFDHQIDTSGSKEDKEALLNELLISKGLYRTPEETLQDLVDLFNFTFEDWMKDHKHGANFDWKYDDRGVKKLTIREVAPISVISEDQKAIKIQQVTESFNELESGNS